MNHEMLGHILISKILLGEKRAKVFLKHEDEIDQMITVIEENKDEII